MFANKIYSKPNKKCLQTKFVPNRAKNGRKKIVPIQTKYENSALNDIQLFYLFLVIWLATNVVKMVIFFPSNDLFIKWIFVVDIAAVMSDQTKRETVEIRIFRIKDQVVD